MVKKTNKKLTESLGGATVFPTTIDEIFDSIEANVNSGFPVEDIKTETWVIDETDSHTSSGFTPSVIRPEYDETEDDYRQVAENLCDDPNGVCYSEDYDKAWDDVGGELEESLGVGFPVTIMSPDAVKAKLKTVHGGARLHVRYVHQVKPQKKWVQGFDNKLKGKPQNDRVQIIKISDFDVCTGVSYDKTKLAQVLHSTTQYQDHLAAQKATHNGKGFNYAFGDPDEELKNRSIQIESTGNWEIPCYRWMSGTKSTKQYYYRVFYLGASDWTEWIPVTDPSTQLSAYFTDTAFNDEFGGGRRKKEIEYQNRTMQNAGMNTTTAYGAKGLIIIDTTTGEQVKFMSHRQNLIYDTSMAKKPEDYEFTGVVEISNLKDRLLIVMDDDGVDTSVPAATGTGVVTESFKKSLKQAFMEGYKIGKKACRGEECNEDLEGDDNFLKQVKSGKCKGKNCKEVEEGYDYLDPENKEDAWRNERNLNNTFERNGGLSDYEKTHRASYSDAWGYHPGTDSYDNSQEYRSGEWRSKY